MPKLRRRVFVGCEGGGERSLASVLQRFADDSGFPVTLDTFDAQGGSPIDMLRRSVRERKLREKRRGLYPGGFYFLVDQDRINADRCDQALTSEAKKNGVVVVRQRLKLECIIGRLVSSNLQLGDARAEEALFRIWPEYEKGFDAVSLKHRISLDVIRRSATFSPEWARFLQTCGFLK